ncbi:MAG TPA: plastocyanin/azurin family copper-binding protein [Candidatus Limnocylindria bacterium]|nr:plastocyanin/azurin family copper-binding protein [Candidatus Limnocylindria bacterium]
MRGVRFALFACALLFFALGSRASATAVTVDIAQFMFKPEVLTITAGDTVTWTNRDSALHNVVFLTGLGQTENFGLGQSSSLRFITAGTYKYICGLHGQSMSGTVVVRPAEGPIAVVTGGAPTFVPPTPTPVPSPGVVVRGADEAPVLPAVLPTSTLDASRGLVLGGIGVLALYLVARTTTLIRRR